MGAGQAKANYSLSTAGLNQANIDDKTIAGRGFFGYQFNYYWAVQFGFANYGKTRFKNMNGSGVEGALRQSGMELLTRIGYPLLQNKLNVFGQVGLSRLHSKVASDLATRSTTLTSDSKQTHLLWGAGVVYDIGKNTTFGIDWRRVQKRKQIQNIDVIGLQLGYHFG